MTLASGLRIALLPAALLVLVGCGDKKDKTAPDTRSHGERVYEASCAGCHGKTGEGDGAAGMRLDPKPTNFKTGPFKRGDSLDAIKNTILKGVEHTAMRPSNIPTADLEAAAEYVRTLSGKKDK